MTDKKPWIAAVAFTLTVTTCVAAGSLDWYHKKGDYRGWRYIVIHHSATDSGSAKAFDRFHTDQGYGGLAYHFVIGNGSGSGDGVVEEGFRWKSQMTGTHVSVDSWDYNIYGIGVCLVGNFEGKLPTPKQWQSLVQLVTRLAKENKISPESIVGHTHVPFDHDPKETQKTSCPGNKFPLDELRRQVQGNLKKV